MWFLRRSLRKRITFLFLAVALVPLLLSAVASVVVGVRFSAYEVSTRQQATITTISPYVSSYIKTIVDNLKLIGTLSVEDDEHRLATLLNACQANPILYTSIALLDPAGMETIVLRDCQLVPADQYQSRVEQEYFFRAQRGEVFVGPVSFSAENEPIVPISQALGDEADSMVIVAEVNLRDLWQRLNLIDLGGESYFYVVDRRGNVISYRDFAVVQQEPNVSNLPPVAALRSERAAFSGREPYSGLLKRDVVGASALLPDINWGIVVEQPVEDAYAFQTTQFIGYLVLIGLVLVIVLLIALLLARSIVRPITALAATATAVAGGDLTQQVDIQSVDELGSVGASFNAMTAQLRQVIGDLEQRVAERTADLTDALHVQEQQSQELQAALAAQSQLNTTISQISVPVIPIQRDVLVVPLIGALDEARIKTMTERVLTAAQRERARAILLDLSGVPVVDHAIAAQLVQTIAALKLLGVRPVIVGINPEVAHDLAQFSAADLPETWATLQQGLASLSRPSLVRR
jgi:rsbT co-antagonist protein RsbR